MSMFYIFFLGCDETVSIEQIKQTVIEILPPLNASAFEDKNQILENTDYCFRVRCDYFSLRVTPADKYMIFKKEDYAMDFKYKFWFDAYREDSDWTKEMLSFIGKLMKTYTGDCVFEPNGDTAILLRKDNVTIADDSRLNGLARYPFHFLDIEYMESEIKINNDDVTKNNKERKQ